MICRGTVISSWKKSRGKTREIESIGYLEIKTYFDKLAVRNLANNPQN